MDIFIDNPPPILFPLGIGLSVLIMAFLLAAILDVWRRPDLPGVTYGGITLSPRRMRWFWVLFLGGALGFSVNEDPVATRPIEFGDLEPGEPARPSAPPRAPMEEETRSGPDDLTIPSLRAVRPLEAGGMPAKPFFGRVQTITVLHSFSDDVPLTLVLP